MRLDYLYGSRSVNLSLLIRPASQINTGKRGSFGETLAGIPTAQIADQRARKRSESPGHTQEMVPPSSHQKNGNQGLRCPPSLRLSSDFGRWSECQCNEAEIRPAANGHAANEAPTSRLAGHGSRSLVMDEYLRTMEQFLTTQQDGRGLSYYRRRQAPPSDGHHEQQPLSFAVPPASRAAYGPFHITMQSLIAGQELPLPAVSISKSIYSSGTRTGRLPSRLDETLMALS